MSGKIENISDTAPVAEQRPARGWRFYLKGGWLFFKKMWPAVYDLSTSETYVFASAIAFNALLSFFSFVVLIGAFLIHVARWQHGYETIYRLMMAFVPVESGLLFRSLDEVTRGPGGQVGLFSVALLIFSSSGAFLPLEIALNRAWGFKQTRGVIKQQVIYLPLVIACAAIILGAVALISVWDYVLGGLLGEAILRRLIFNTVGTVVSLPFIVLIFFLIYYLLPNSKVQGSQIFFSSVAMGALWVMATFVYQLLIPAFNFRGSYGGMYGLMAVVIWVFISSFILILGANLSAREILPRAWTGRLPLKFRRPQAD
jgi:membrane protein/epoxyqueuosine reductase